jgi:hypothetical protein
MNRPVFVSNASPIIAFERLSQLSLLQQLTQTLHIPQAVRREVFGSQSLPGWVIEKTLVQPLSQLPLSPRLGAGESEAIALALELAPCQLVIDDLAARRAAQSLNIPIVGTVGLLILARQKTLIPILKSHLDTLRQADFRIADRVYELALRQVGETP